MGMPPMLAKRDMLSSSVCPPITATRFCLGVEPLMARSCRLGLPDTSTGAYPKASVRSVTTSSTIGPTGMAVVSSSILTAPSMKGIVSVPAVTLYRPLPAVAIDSVPETMYTSGLVPGASLSSTTGKPLIVRMSGAFGSRASRA